MKLLTKEINATGAKYLLFYFIFLAVLELPAYLSADFVLTFSLNLL